MENNLVRSNAICVVGKSKLGNDISGFLEKVGHKISFLDVNSDWPTSIQEQLVIVIAPEDLEVKRSWVAKLEAVLSLEAIIAINIEAIRLTDLQETAVNPKRILGLNWVYPVENTYFLEIISNSVSDPNHPTFIENLAKERWNKDPYCLDCGFSVRARLMAAITREALFLVDEGYATLESIDRSCRNDAGYYLSFAGNFRYMDLMGTAVYGIVMETLNRELAAQSTLGSFERLLNESNPGMESGNGFFSYESGDAERWEEIVQDFTDKISNLMQRYPITFNY